MKTITSTKPKNEIGLNIKKYRLEKELSQEAFAEKVYSTKSTISKWESGDITPSIDMLKIIAKSLGVSVYSILGEKQPLSSKIFSFFGRVLFWGFIWVHVDITFVWTTIAVSAVMMAAGIFGGLGGFVTHLTGMIMHDNVNSMRIAILIGYIIWIPLMFAIFFGVGLGLYVVGRQVFAFSLRYFWRNTKASFKMKEISWINKLTKKHWIIFSVILSISFIYLVVLCSIDGTQNNWSNFLINF